MARPPSKSARKLALNRSGGFPVTVTRLDLAQRSRFTDGEGSWEKLGPYIGDHDLHEVYLHGESEVAEALYYPIFERRTDGAE